MYFLLIKYFGYVFNIIMNALDIPFNYTCKCISSVMVSVLVSSGIDCG
jgi:hypothetical protein